jgi:hypothetical protein
MVPNQQPCPRPITGTSFTELSPIRRGFFFNLARHHSEGEAGGLGCRRGLSSGPGHSSAPRSLREARLGSAMVLPRREHSVVGQLSYGAHLPNILQNSPQGRLGRARKGSHAVGLELGS